MGLFPMTPPVCQKLSSINVLIQDRTRKCSAQTPVKAAQYVVLELEKC